MIVVRAVRCATAECLVISCSTHRPSALDITGRQAGADDARDQIFLVGLVSGYGSSNTRGLPGGMKVEDLLVAKVEPIPSVSDRNPDVECEFFHTRQVCHCPCHVVTSLLVMHTKHPLLL